MSKHIHVHLHDGQKVPFSSLAVGDHFAFLPYVGKYATTQIQGIFKKRNASAAEDVTNKARHYSIKNKNLLVERA